MNFLMHTAIQFDAKLLKVALRGCDLSERICEREVNFGFVLSPDGLAYGELASFFTTAQAALFHTLRSIKLS